MSERSTIEAQQQELWDRYSAGWIKWDHVVQSMLRPVGEEMIAVLGVGADAHVLDAASGTGEPGLTIAARVPEGRVVLTDLSSGMLAVASDTAAARGLDHVEVRQAGADALPFDDASFDAVTCRFGLMFVPDVAATLDELHRVLRLDGRLACAVWAGPQDNPWVTMPMSAIGAEVELPAPAPDAPGMFRCAQPGAVADLLRAAGFDNVEERRVGTTLSAQTAEEYWTMMTEVAAPVVAGLAAADDAGRDRICAAAVEAARAFEADGGVSVPGVAICVAGTKARPAA